MEYEFGYCRYKWSLLFSGGSIVPHADFDSSKKWIEKYKHRDEFIFPPMKKSVTESRRTIPHSKRPAHLFQLPRSHVLDLKDRKSSDLTREYASYAIHLLGYYFGGMYQFADWWFDARVPLKSMHNIVVRHQTAESFLSHGWDTWCGWAESDRRRFTNILFMLNRAPAYEWDWEHFIAEYMVFDGCYRMAKALGHVAEARDIPHSKRIAAMCDLFNIPKDDTLIGKIVKLRNDLFHETLWDAGRPGASTDITTLFAPLHLRRLNLRLIPAILKYPTGYIKTSWWTLGSCSF